MALDDRNPAFVYSGDWYGAGSDAELLQTTTWTNSTGSTAIISFTGTSVSVWGTIAPLGLGTAPQSSYNVDNGPATLFVGTQQSGTQYKQCFFQSAQLLPTNHTLRLQTLVSGAYYYLDYVTVVPTNNEKIASPIPSTSTTVSASQPTSTTAVSTNPSSTLFPIGAIIGGVLGSLALIMLGIVAVMWLQRRRNDSGVHRRNRPTEVNVSLWTRRPDSTSSSSDITPFITQSYRPLLNHNYAEEMLVDYSLAINNRTQLQDPFDTYRSAASSSTARYNQSDSFSTPLLESRDPLPASKISGQRPVQDHIHLSPASASGPSSGSLAPPPDVPPPDYH